MALTRLLRQLHIRLPRQQAQNVGVQTLNRKRIYILPSMYGLGLIALVLGLLIGAINYQVSLTFFVAFLLLGLAHSLLLRTFLNLYGLTISVLSSTNAFKGETAYFRLRLSEQNGRARQQLCIQAEGEAEEGCLLELAAGKETEVLVPVSANSRGKLRLPRCKISSTAPIAWFYCWSYLHLDSSILVYPAPEQNPPPLPSGRAPEGNGRQTITGMDEISGLRPYQIGDMAQHIAWKQSARSGQLSSKLLEATAGDSLLLDWDLVELPFEARLSRLCAWVLAADMQGIPYTLLLPECRIGPGTGIAHRNACLSRLALQGGAAA